MILLVPSEDLKPCSPEALSLGCSLVMEMKAHTEKASSALENHLPGLTVLQIRSSGERVQDQLWPCVVLDTVVSVTRG